MSEALIRVSDPAYSGLVMHSAPAEARRRMEELQAFIKEAMDEGIDYGTIPGTDKPTLFQPGAQKLSELYGLAQSFAFDVQTEDWDKPFFYYRVVCSLTDRRSGCFVGMGIGSCNSREKKYAGRWVPEADAPSWLDVPKLKHREALTWLWKSKLPPGVDIATLPTQERDGKQGRYTVYGVRTAQVFVPNEEIADLVNTLQKMAIKRALVGAVNSVTRSSGIFAQDVEDLPPEAMGYVESRRPWERDDEPPPEPAAERPDVAAAREKLAKQAEKRAGKKAPAEAAPPAPLTPEQINAAMDTADRATFTTLWAAVKARPDYEEIKAAVAASFARNKARLWPESVKPATPPPAEAPPPRDPKLDTWMGEISSAGGNEGEDVWSALNDAYDGQIPAELVRAFEVRWPPNVDQGTEEVRS